MLERITVRVRFPHPKMNVQHKGSWESGAGLRRDMEAEAIVDCKNAMAAKCVMPGDWERATLFYRFYMPDRVRRDPDNYIFRMKKALDGCVKAGLIRGDDWKRLEIGGATFSLAPHDPRVELSFVRGFTFQQELGGDGKKTNRL